MLRAETSQKMMQEMMRKYELMREKLEYTKEKFNIQKISIEIKRSGFKFITFLLLQIYEESQFQCVKISKCQNKNRYCP